MDKPRCPGQDQRYWTPDDIFFVSCPTCSTEIEFWKDEPLRICVDCRTEVRNPRMDFGCARWCRSAADCVGVEAAGAAREATVYDRLIAEMRAVFGADERRIEHTLAVLAYARTILEAEGGDPLVVQAAAILHDIGIPEAERKDGAATAYYQEREGPLVAQPILEELGLPADTIDHVCRIIGSHHTGGDIDTVEFRIVWDADWLANLPTRYGEVDASERALLIETTFRTQRGRELARELFGRHRSN